MRLRSEQIKRERAARNQRHKDRRSPCELHPVSPPDVFTGGGGVSIKTPWEPPGDPESVGSGDDVARLAGREALVGGFEGVGTVAIWVNVVSSVITSGRPSPRTEISQTHSPFFFSRCDYLLHTCDRPRVTQFFFFLKQ